MKTDSKKARTARFYEALYSLGFTYQEAETLRLAEKTLHRWAERECNGEVERDESTGKTFTIWDNGRALVRSRTADRETGALKRIAAVIDARNARCGESPAVNETGPKGVPVSFYHQTDPRGCALYILRIGDVPEGKEVESYYSRGLAVCI